MKLLVALVFIAILFALGSALMQLLRPGQKDRRAMARSLTWRIGLSIALFVLLLIAHQLGWIAPHGVQ